MFLEYCRRWSRAWRAGLRRGWTPSIHKAGLVNGDLKPGNIMLQQGTFTPVLVDLGMGHTAGSPDYMSPRQFRSAVPTSADDIFAFGAILFEAASGSRPWPDEDLLPAAIRRATEDAPSLSGNRHALPSGFCEAVVGAAGREAPRSCRHNANGFRARRMPS